MQTPVNEVLTLALQCHQAGDLARAEYLYRQVLRAEAEHADAQHLLGVLLSQSGDPGTGAEHIVRALALAPDNVLFLRNLGLTYQNAGRLREAAVTFRHVLRLQPDDADTHFKLGTVHGALAELDEAATCYRRVLRLRPEDSDAGNNLGNVLQEQGKLDEAIACFQSALRRRPGDATLHNNLGNALKCRGDFSPARQCFEEAIRLLPSLAEAHWNLAIILLLLGDFERGWVEYEWRRQCPALTMPSTDGTPWNGVCSPGLRLLLRTEQGLGDTLQFVRYAASLAQKSMRVIVEAQRPLVALLRGCAGIEQVVAQGEALPRFDVQIPLLSAPRLFGTTSANVPADVPYLEVRPELAEQWRARLAFVPGLRIGIAWQGNPQNKIDRWRSIPLRQFAPLARLGSVSLVSLQVGPGTEQLDQMPGFALDLGPELTDFAHTAAAIKNLDLVVSIDSAMAHLAGALAMPVWVPLPHIPDWRWLLDRDDSPWYPSMRLFRQRQLGTWEEVFTRMAELLGRKLGARKS